MHNILKVYTDGASSGNPGPGWAMWVIKKPKAKSQKLKEQEDCVLIEKRERLNYCTNNEAEYLAVIYALKDLIAHPDFYKSYEKIIFHLDSNLVVQQVNGVWKIKEPRMAAYKQEIDILLIELKTVVKFTYIPREQNIADKLKYL